MDSNIEEPKQFKSLTYGENFLLAAENGWTEVVEIFIAQHLVGKITLCLNAEDSDDQTALMPYLNKADFDNALMLAARYGHLEIIHLFIEEHFKKNIFINPNRQDDEGLSPIMWAAKNGHAHTIEAFISFFLKDQIKPEKISFYLNLKSDKNFDEEPENENEEMIEKGETALMFAAQMGHVNVVQTLIPYFHENALNTTNNSDETALIMAAKNGHVEIVECLIARVAQLKVNLNLNIKDSAKFTALMWAAARGHISVVKSLISHHADVGAALIGAAGNGHIKAVNTLIPHLNAERLSAKDNMGQTAFMWAAKNGHVAIMNSLINLGFSQNLDQQDIQGLTALMHAVKEGQLLAVKMLLKNGADTTLADNENKSALMYAAINGNLTVFDILMEYADSADLNAISDNSGKTVLIWAAKYGQIAIIEKLLCYFSEKDITPNLNAQDNKGHTALMLAVLNSNRSTVELLLSNGADLTLRNNDNETALIQAVSIRHVGIFNDLISNYNLADINLLDDSGKTALMWAASHGLTAIVEALFLKGADFNIINNNQETALVLAAQNGHLDVVNFIMIKFNISVLSASNFDGMTPLMWAARNEHVDVVNAFIAHLDIAELNRANNWGRTALMLAAEEGHVEVVNVLSDSMDTAAMNISDNDRKTALMIAAEQGHTEVVKIFLSRPDANRLNSENDLGITALMYTVLNNQIDVVNTFILYFDVAALNAANAQGKTALMLACENHNDDETIAVNLINHFIQIDQTALNKVDDSDLNALMYAAMNDMQNIVKLLMPYLDKASIDKENQFILSTLIFAAIISDNIAIVEFTLPYLEVDVLNIVNESGKTAMMYAVELGNLSIVNALLIKKVNLNFTDEEGRTALMLSAMVGHEEVLKALVTHLKITDLNKQDEDGNTAMMLATQRGYFSLVEILISRGADVNLCNKDQYNALMVASNNNDVDIAFRLISAVKGQSAYIQNNFRLNLFNSNFKSLVMGTQKWMFEILWIFNKIPGFNNDISSTIVADQTIYPRWYHHLIEDNVKLMLKLLDRKLVEKYKKTNAETPKLCLLAEVFPAVPPVEPVTLSRPKRKRATKQAQDNSAFLEINSETRYPKRINRFRGSYPK